MPDNWKKINFFKAFFYGKAFNCTPFAACTGTGQDGEGKQRKHAWARRGGWIPEQSASLHANELIIILIILCV